MKIRNVRESDLGEVRKLNEAALPHVNSIPVEDFEYFMEISSFFVVVEEEESIGGFFIVLGPGQKYDSENYRYFSENYSTFDYVDRIVIREESRGKGFGTALYNYLFDHSDQQRVTCEVNIDPPNPLSTQFHKKIGFREVGRQHSEAGKKLVSLMVMEL
jgi:hypothetical protein